VGQLVPRSAGDQRDGHVPPSEFTLRIPLWEEILAKRVNIAGEKTHFLGVFPWPFFITWSLIK